MTEEVIYSLKETMIPLVNQINHGIRLACQTNAKGID